MSNVYSVMEVARDLRIAEAQVYKAIRCQELQALRFGRVIRIPKACLDAWLEKLTSSPASPQVVVQLPAPIPLTRPAPALVVAQPAPPVLQGAVLPPGSAVAPVRVEAPVKAPAVLHIPNLDVLVSRHEGILAWLRRHGVQAPVFQGVARRSDLVGRSVLGSLPLELAIHCGRLFMVRIPTGAQREWSALTADDLDDLKAYVVEVTFDLSEPYYPA